jgi:hypothetical protein
MTQTVLQPTSDFLKGLFMRKQNYNAENYIQISGGWFCLFAADVQTLMLCYPSVHKYSIFLFSGFFPQLTAQNQLSSQFHKIQVGVKEFFVYF